MKNLNFHKYFRLNGIQFNSRNDLLAYSKSVSSSIHSFLNNWFDDKLFVNVQTSGSTGEPKNIRLEKKYMINSAFATGHYFNLPDKTTALLCLSTDYIAGKMMLVRALVLGWELDIAETNSNPLKEIQKAYDFSAMVPMQVYNSMEDLYRVDKLIVGGGVVSSNLERKLASISTAIYATYGMTETITHIAVKKLNHLSKTEVESGSHYTILPNIKISNDARGCLVIDAPKISDEKIITNDLVKLISDDKFRWLGRYDTIINSGGIKLIPEQIERKLSQVIEDRFFVSSLPDDSLGEKLIVVIESIDRTENTIWNEIRKLSSLHKFEIPKEIYRIEKFIETETNKINRKETLDTIFES